MSQAMEIANHLKAGYSLTAIEALQRFNCFRLAARIHDLRASGMDVRDREITTESGKRVAQYYMEMPEQGELTL